MHDGIVLRLHPRGVFSVAKIADSYIIIRVRAYAGRLDWSLGKKVVAYTKCEILLSVSASTPSVHTV